MTHTTIDSPIGPLLLTARDGALSGVFMDGHHRLPADASVAAADTSALAPVVEQLEAYFAGSLRSFDLALVFDGTPFQRRVWQALCDIPYGETVSYGTVASRIGAPGASRAVGLANGRNPISIVVPCHRVIGADGSLTGYGGGLERKRALLDLERAHAGMTLC